MHTDIETYFYATFRTTKRAPKRNKETVRTNDKVVRANVDRGEAKNEGKMPVVSERKRTMWAGASHESKGARNAG